ncbi:MAG: gamma-glutamylcyclotransferase [Deltaproteobacteria bacterium]|nr:gamma-glutamylcyclotransferase [Deltaproteobacteria bacterium]
MILYFAYGSNLDWGQMKERCPSTLFVDTALLSKYRLAFSRMSVARQCGVADIVPDEKKDVWGIVYQITERDLETLDQYEGFQPGRAKNPYIQTEVVVFAKGASNNPITAITYIVQDKAEKHIPPNREYLDLIIHGARHWHLPQEYIDSIEGIGVEG